MILDFQIRDRKYYESYLAENKQIILLGVGFLGKKEIDMQMEILPTEKWQNNDNR